MKKSQARVAAQLKGERTYVPEAPCARGHSLRTVGTGTCIACRHQTETARVAASRPEYNARKTLERANRLPEIAAMAKAARANETPIVRVMRLEAAKIKQREWRAANPSHAGSAAAKKKYKCVFPFPRLTPHLIAWVRPSTTKIRGRKRSGVLLRTRESAEG